MEDKVLFLAWGSPWPARAGATLRTLGLLQAIGMHYEVDLLVASRRPLEEDAASALRSFTTSVTSVTLRRNIVPENVAAGLTMLTQRCPFHCALLRRALAGGDPASERILNFDGVVYASMGHWGTLVACRRSPNWILDQHNADVDFWRVYARQATSPATKAAALLNWSLAAHHFPLIYRSVGRVVSVCEGDRQLTLQMSGGTPVSVIENGVDCSAYAPDRSSTGHEPRILFTGTSTQRNMVALRGFVRDILPIVRRQMPVVELLVAGNFSPGAQTELGRVDGVRFTGPVADIRPHFNASDVYIAPFRETYGSKLKIAEAMAMAMPIVSTPAGIRGFPLVDGESVRVGSSPREFAACIVELLADPAQRRRLGEAARAAAVEHVDWKVLGHRLVQLIEGAHYARSKHHGDGSLARGTDLW